MKSREITLAIDTSCDETSVAITCSTEVWSNVVASQAELHKPYGGVFPTVAKQAHRENIWLTVVMALKRARVKKKEISCVAVTIGPGLAPALEVGLGAGAALAAKWHIPLVPVNHLEGHLVSVLAKPRPRNRNNQLSKATAPSITSDVPAVQPTNRYQKPITPPITSQAIPLQPSQRFLGLLVSGKHTSFIDVVPRLSDNGAVKISPFGLCTDQPILQTMTLSDRVVDSANFLLSLLPGNIAETLSISNTPITAEAISIKPTATNLQLLDRVPNLSLAPKTGRIHLHSGRYHLRELGSTLDDAAGEALDKTGRMLNLGYPAGPVLEVFAKQGDERKYDFPLPLTQTKTYDLSYSGIKTYTRNLVEQMGGSKRLERQQIYDLAASIQYAIFRHICYKLNKLLEDNKTEQPFAEIWLGGGVAANVRLRNMVRETFRKQRHGSTVNKKSTSFIGKSVGEALSKVKTPYAAKLCGDNAGMIGITLKTA